MNLYSNTKTIHKPWGKEVWLHLDNNYCYKRIHINAGYKTSYQYHVQKSETNYIIQGKAEIWLEDENGIVQKYEMNEGDYFTVPPPRKHRVIAITDVILQEVSTPHVDDVQRINDEFGRGEGKIESEHQTPAFVILAAGKGERVKSVTRNLHKGLLKIGDQAAISYLIDKVPAEYEIIVVLGYNGHLIRDYCLMAHPDRHFKFVSVADFESPESGPGKSILACKDLLQRPFYFTVVDCMFTGPLPPMDSNWIGVSQTDLPEIYSTAKIENGTVVDFKNKSKDGYENAFSGLAFIRDYNLFWESLNESKEIVYAFENRKFELKVKNIEWEDIGTIDGYHRLTHNREAQKKIEEQTYVVGGRFIKINSDIRVTKERADRAKFLGDLVPVLIEGSDYCLVYNYIRADTLYSLNNFGMYGSFIEWYLNTVAVQETNFVYDDATKRSLAKKFYIDKTLTRLNQFRPDDTFNKVLVEKFSDLLNPVMYKNFHGDLQPDNIIYDGANFKYIDWRPNFAGAFDGDLYYDLGKFYGGLTFNYKAAKNPEVFHFIDLEYYEIPQTENMKLAATYFEKRCKEKGFDWNKIVKMRSLIWLNMTPIHEPPMGQILFNEAIKYL